MEQTPLPPLVSDEQMQADAEILSKESTAPDAETPNWMIADVRRGIRHARDIYEADRLKTREVVQALVNMIHHRYMDHPADTLANAKYYASGGLSTVDALALAKSTLNIKPKQ